MATTWFTSDLHLGHPFVAELRGYDEVEEHDRVVLGNLQDTVTDADTLWVLGDISSGWAPQEERALQLLADFRTHTPGVSMHLIAGNHDSCHPLHRNGYMRQRDFLQVFDSVQPYQKLRWIGGNGQKQAVYLCHFPRPGMDHEDMNSRYDDVRLDVPYLVHGHLHSDHPNTGPGMVDVGQDAWGMRPVAHQDVQDVLFS